MTFINSKIKEYKYFDLDYLYIDDCIAYYIYLLDQLNKQDISLLFKKHDIFQNLSSIMFINCKINDKALKVLCDHFYLMNNLVNLKLECILYSANYIDNNISDKGIEYFCEKCDFLKNLKFISFHTNKITDKGYKILCKYIYKLSNLKKINLESIFEILYLLT